VSYVLPNIFTQSICHFEEREITLETPLLFVNLCRYTSVISPFGRNNKLDGKHERCTLAKGKKSRETPQSFENIASGFNQRIAKIDPQLIKKNQLPPALAEGINKAKKGFSQNTHLAKALLLLNLLIP